MAARPAEPAWLARARRRGCVSIGCPTPRAVSGSAGSSPELLRGRRVVRGFAVPVGGSLGSWASVAVLRLLIGGRSIPWRRLPGCLRVGVFQLLGQFARAVGDLGLFLGEFLGIGTAFGLAAHAALQSLQAFEFLDVVLHAAAFRS